jgi:hypothetical protein
MDYKKIYDQITQRSKSENRTKGKDIYYEAHHIIPLCMGGEGKTSQWKWHTNVVLLTAREHFLCHWLLHRIYPENIKLLYAFDKMRVISPTHKNNRCIPSSTAIKEIVESKRRLGKGEDFKILMSKKYLGVERPKLKCPYCEKIGGTGNMQRWHFDNCLNKPGNENMVRKPPNIRKKRQFKGYHSEIALLAYKNISEKRKKRVINCNTNELYNSIAECMETLGITYKQFCKKINNKELKKIEK